MSGGADMSAGTVSQEDQRLKAIEIQEETDRLWGKRIVFFGSCGLIVVFYAVFLCLASHFWKADGKLIEIDHWHGAILLFIAVIPTLILMNLSRMVKRHHPATDDDLDEIDWHPLISLIKELAKAFKKE